MLPNEITDIFKKYDENLLLITIGNPYRADDGIGSYIFYNLKSELKNLKVINAGSNPENAIYKIFDYKPKITIIIDAANFMGETGEARIIQENNISQLNLSTHTFPINAITKIISEDTGCDTAFIGIQIGNLTFGGEISEQVKLTGNEIIDYINTNF